MKYTLYFYLEETYPGGCDGKTRYLKVRTFKSWSRMLSFARRWLTIKDKS